MQKKTKPPLSRYQVRVHKQLIFIKNQIRDKDIAILLYHKPTKVKC
jgi:outer membrane protein assembly factor BamD (BamD/ComL family)